MNVLLMKVGERSYLQNPTWFYFCSSTHDPEKAAKTGISLESWCSALIPTTTLQEQLLPFVLTWHEQTEHLSFSSTQIWPLCLILPSWIQSPVQFLPWGHRQSYPPSKLKQTVSLAQLCLPVPHSSMSAKTCHGMLLDHIQLTKILLWQSIEMILSH